MFGGGLPGWMSPLGQTRCFSTETRCRGANNYLVPGRVGATPWKLPPPPLNIPKRSQRSGPTACRTSKIFPSAAEVISTLDVQLLLYNNSNEFHIQTFPPPQMQSQSLIRSTPVSPCQFASISYQVFYKLEINPTSHEAMTITTNCPRPPLPLLLLLPPPPRASTACAPRQICVPCRWCFSAPFLGIQTPASPCSRTVSWLGRLQRLYPATDRDMCPTHVSFQIVPYLFTLWETYPVLVKVLVVEYALAGGVIHVIPRRRDIDEQAGRRVDPPRINHVVPVICLPVPEVRVHFEQKLLALGRTVVVLVVPGRHVVVGSEEEHVCLTDLDVCVKVPWHDLK